MVGIREVEGTGFNFFGNCLIWGCFGLWFLLRIAGRGRPAATHFSLLRQRKVSKRKATRSLGPYASLRATCGARLRRGLAQTRFACMFRVLGWRVVLRYRPLVRTDRLRLLPPRL